MTEPVAPAGALEERDPPAEPTQHAPRGLRFDFNDGARVLLPPAERDWRVRLTDLDAGSVLLDTTLAAGLVRSIRRHYLRIRIEVWHGDEAAPVLCHDHDPRGRDVLVQLPAGTLGDTIAWFPAVAQFAERHGCRLTCTLHARFFPLFQDAYPAIRLTTAAEVRPERFYSTYKVMLYYRDDTHRHQPSDYQQIGLHHAASYLLGTAPSEAPPRLVIPDGTRPLAEPYVCIAVQSTAQCKKWNNPRGWAEVVQFLKDSGYRVVCIDRHPVHGEGSAWTSMPNGAEDQTGDRPLAERARWLKHAAFFVGLSSGLSWLAWAAGCPVVLISGFTHPINEFHTPYRVINWHTCNSCWNDVRLRFDNRDYFWCPRQKGTPRQFECTKLITAAQVIGAIQRIPGFFTASPASRDDGESAR